eukprot:tig00020960_g16602.t1
MAYRTNAKSMAGLVDGLVREGIVKSRKVEDVLRRVDRGAYVKHRHEAYEDRPSGIGHDVTISAPHMHAYALEALEGHLRPNSRALDVGSGSGFLTVCMALMGAARVIGIECIPELVNSSTAAVRRDHPELLDKGRIRFVHGNGYNGFPEEGPYDAIHVGAAAHDGLPAALVEQLAPGGRMIIPVGSSITGQSLVQVDKSHDGRITETDLMGVMYVPLYPHPEQVPSEKTRKPTGGKLSEY